MESCRKISVCFFLFAIAHALEILALIVVFYKADVA